MSRTGKDAPNRPRSGLRLLLGAGPSQEFINHVWTSRDRQTARAACCRPWTPDTRDRKGGSGRVPGDDPGTVQRLGVAGVHLDVVVDAPVHDVGL